MSEFKKHRLVKEPCSPWEIQGVLNPDAVRGRHGDLCLFPRLLAQPDRSGMAGSRIGVARLNLPDFLPPQAGAVPLEGQV